MRPRDIAVIVLIVACFVAYDAAVAWHYQPDTVAERVVGYFVLPGELLTGDESLHSDVVSELEDLPPS